MLVYWLLFIFFAVGALNWRRGDPAVRAVGGRMLGVGAVGVALIIGLRYRVGADWDTYQFMFDYARISSLERMLRIGDPAFQFLNWSARTLEFQIWTVNLVCGAIFSWGVWRFAKAQAEPWLAMLVAVPYLIIVVSMGYTRQAVAIGIIMAGLAALIRGATLLRFAVYVLVAALFHKTAVVVLPLVMLAAGRNRALNIAAGVLLFIPFFNFFLADSVDSFVQNYVHARYASRGAGIRVAMGVAPALLFIGFRKAFNFTPAEERLWMSFSLAALFTLVLLILVPSSTAVDRISLYVLPLQLAIFARLPVLQSLQGSGKFVVIAGAFAVQFVWLNFAVHARYWVPYQFFPIG